jgi:hypothetical protein
MPPVSAGSLLRFLLDVGVSGCLQTILRYTFLSLQFPPACLLHAAYKRLVGQRGNKQRPQAISLMGHWQIDDGDSDQ